MEIIKADDQHISMVAPLLDQYRVFYKQDSDLNAAEVFLKERITENESVIFLAMNGKESIGFVQLYTTFSTVSLEPVFILNDLYVSNKHRGKGIGEALLNHAKLYCIEKKHKGLALETAVDNPAQHLYERLGWTKDSDCFHYFWNAE